MVIPVMQLIMGSYILMVVPTNHYNLDGCSKQCEYNDYVEQSDIELNHGKLIH